jgi:hypothetical protein
MDSSWPTLTKGLEYNDTLETIRVEYLFDLNDEVENALKARDKRVKSKMMFKVAILAHNIARSKEAMTVLPTEIWKSIFSNIKFDTVECGPMAKKVLNRP